MGRRTQGPPGRARAEARVWLGMKSARILSVLRRRHGRFLRLKSERGARRAQLSRFLYEALSRLWLLARPAFCLNSAVDESRRPRHSGNPDQPQARILAAGQGRTWSAFDERVTIKADQADTGGAFELLEATLPPYSGAGQPHWHAQQSEVLYVLDGTLAMTLGDETLTVRRGGCVVVPPHLVHVIWNPTGASVTYLTLSAPAGREAFLAAMAAARAAGALNPPQLLVLAAQHDQFAPPAPR